MKIEETRNEHAYIVKITGKVDTASYRYFENTMLDVLETEKNVLLDCTDMTYISSAGIRVFLMVLKTLQSKNGQLKLCGIRNDTKEIFEISGVSKLFEIYTTQLEAYTNFD
ncbi:MAG: STAS domain-containing protein [Bacteroidales bacterium]|nr:STAS domain-containing protein [Bacteroidales bacterium]